MPSQWHNGGKWITAERRLAIYLRDGFCCQWCLTPLVNAHPKDVTLDHLIPREELGGNESSNLVTSCRLCNTTRGAYTVYTFARKIASDIVALGGCLTAPNGDLLYTERDICRQVVNRIRNARKRRPNIELAKAILAGSESDPRPVVRTAREKGRTLAPARSAAAMHFKRARAQK